MENKYPTNGELTSGQNIPFWIDSIPPLSFETLDKPMQTDVLVIGGGISGLSTAFQLVKKGKQMKKKLHTYN